MAPLSLKIVLDEGAVTRTLMFDTTTLVQDAHTAVHEKILTLDPDREYGFFLQSADDDCSGVWLEPHRRLEYYMLREGDPLKYLPKHRNLRLRMLDDSVKTVQIDESKKVGDLMFYICNKIGIANHEEYGLCDTEDQQMEEAKATGTLSRPATGTLTLKRGAPKEKDAELQQLIKKFKTDNNVEWLDHHKTLRELRIDPKKTLLLKRRLFYSDRNVDARDPLQLNLLYVQTRDAILDGAHVVTEDKAVEFAGIQCQIQYGDFQEEKHKSGFIENLKEFLPTDFTGSWGVEKKIYREHRKHTGLSALEAKQLYVKLARSLPTYGVTFFVVKEKQKGKKKLVPRLLGINAESILRLDEQTKETLQTWLLTQVKTYKASTETFTLNFGDYSDKEYAVKTNESFRIKDILEGYIDIIRKKLSAPSNTEYVEGEVITEDNIGPSRGSTITNYTAQKMQTHSLVGPSQIVAVEQGHNVGKGTNITTVHQIVTTMAAGQQQHGVSALNQTFVEELSDSTGRRQFGKKLNFLNSESVKAVVLLSEPSKANIQNVQEIAQSMEDVLPEIIKGVKDNAAKKDEAESQKILADLDELYSYITNLTDAIKDCEPTDDDKLMGAQNAAKKIADLSTQIYFSCDSKSKRRSQLLLRSRSSFIEDEKTVATLRRASFITAADGAKQAVEDAQKELYEIYNGPVPDDEDIIRIENDAAHKLGKLNAAVAHLLIAHADPDNVDYEMAVNSMKTINEYVPQLTNDAKIIGAAESEPHRTELLDKIKKLLDETTNLCLLIGTDDTNKMQETGNQYADTSKKLMFTFGKRKPKPKQEDKCDEIKDLVMAVGDATNQLLRKVEELGAVAGEDADYERVDRSAVKCADAVQALLACAELTSQSIQEPHCQSALTAAIENLASSSQNMSAAWKPVVEKPGNHIFGMQLVDLSMKLAKALDNLKDSYSNLNGLIEDDIEIIEVEPINDDKKRLKFIKSVAHLKKDIDNANKNLDKPNEPAIGSAVNVKKSNRKLADKLAELNAAIATLLQATTDRENHNLDLAQSSIDTIRQLTSEISDDTRLLNGNINPVKWSGLKAELNSMFDAVNDICANATENDGEGLNDSISKYSTASMKLVKTCRPQSFVAPKSIVELSKKACEETSQMLVMVNDLAENVDVEDGNVLDEAGAKLADTAQATLRTAEITSPTINYAQCRQSMICAVDNHAAISKDLENTWKDVLRKQPNVSTPVKEGLENNHGRLQDLLNEIRELCSKEIGDPENEVQKEKQRLQFIASLSNAKNTIEGATKDLEYQNIKDYGPDDKMNVNVIRRGLADKLAQLNAALASLVQASGDPSNPDTELAQAASENIHKVVPDIVEAIKRLRGSLDDQEYKAITDDLKAMLQAAQDICDNDDGKDKQEAVSRLSNSSGKLIFTFKPVMKSKKEKQVQDLANSARKQTAVMLAKVNKLAQSVGGDLGQEMDIVGAQVADSAKTLNTTAKITAPSIHDADCKKSLASAVDAQSSLLKELNNTLQPVVQNPNFMHYKDDLLIDSQGIQETLDKLRNLCQLDQGEIESVQLSDSISDPKQRLVFTSTLASANNALEDARKDLNNIEKSAPLNLKGNVQERKLRLKNKLAQLNAAITSLVDASADSNNPDIKQVESAIEAIRKIAPDLIEDVKALHGNVDNKSWEAIVKNLKVALEATNDLCGSQNTEDINDVLNKFAAATGNLAHVLDPESNDNNEKKVLGLSRLACENTSAMLSKVYELAGEVTEDDAQVLDHGGAKVASAAQALLNIAEISAPSIDDGICRASLMSAVDRHSLLAKELEDACKPIVLKPHHIKHKDGLQHSSQAVQDTLGKLKEFCQELGHNKELEAKQQLLQNGIVSAKSVVDEAIRSLDDTKTMGHRATPDGDVRQRKRALADKLAHLNAALASLMQATADEDNPDVDLAAGAIETIQKLAPEVVHDVKSLDGQVDDTYMAAITGDLKAMLEATSHLCDKTENKNVNEIVQNLGRASSKMLNMINPKTNVKKEKEISDLARVACEQTSAMLLQVYPLAESAGGEAGQALDRAGARVVDAAQLLFSTSILTAPSIKDVRCSNALIAAADNHSTLMKELEGTWKPVLAKSEYRQHKDGLERDAATIHNTLDKLRELCHNGDPENEEQKEKQRLQFIASLSNAKNTIEGATKDLEYQNIKDYGPDDKMNVNVIRRGLADKLAQLNATLASLVQASGDPSNPDTELAQAASENIHKVVPDIVEAIKRLRGSLDDQEYKAITDDLKAMLQAAQDICDNDDGKDKQEAVSRLSKSSGKLIFTFKPVMKSKKEKQVQDLANSARKQTAVMLAKVNKLAQSVGGDLGQEVDIVGAQVADSAKTLNTTAKITAPSIHDADCKKSLASAVDAQSSLLKELNNTLQPVVQNPNFMHYKDDLLIDSQGIQETLDKLRNLCQPDQGEIESVQLSDSISDPKQRLVFTSTLASANNALEDARKDLNNIEKSAPLNLKGNVQERKLRLKNKLAQLNAAITSLVDASADSNNPDIKQVESAIEAIRKIAPDLIEDVKALHGNVDNKSWEAIVKNLKVALEATNDLCGSQNTEDINDVLNKFAAATGNLAHVLDPESNDYNEKKVLGLSRLACENTSAMLSKVYELAGEVTEDDAQVLDHGGAKVASAAQALLNIAEISAPSIDDGICRASLMSAVDRHSLLAKELEDACKPIVLKPHHIKHKDGLQHSSQAVQDTLGKLKEFCQELGHNKELEAKQQLLQNGIVSAKSVVDEAIRSLDDTKTMGHRATPDGDVRQRKRALADKLAHLNAALASLMQATADEDNPDVDLAAGAIETIQKLAPEVVHDVKSLDGQVDDTYMAAITGDLKAMLEATSHLCDKTENKNVNEIVQNLGRASSKMLNMINPKTNVKKEKEISDLARVACEQTSAMLLQVYPLAESAGGEAGQALDRAGARVVDAAQLLFSTSILTAPSIKDVRCSNALIAAADNHSTLMKELEGTWKPVLAKSEYRQHKDGLERDAATIHNTLDKLRELCHNEQSQLSMPEPELDVSEAKENIIKSEALLSERLKKMPKSDPSVPAKQAIEDPQTATQRLLLLKKLAQLNDTMAQLVQAYNVSDDRDLDHKTAQEAIKRLGNLTEEIVKDIIAIEDNTDGDCSQVLKEAKELCKASTNLCGRVEDNDADGINKAAMDYAGHAHKLRFMLSPQTNPAQTNQILESSKSICERTSLMLSRVSRLADLVEPATSNELHMSGAAVGDAAQALLTTAQITASSINDESCKSRLMSSADKLLASSQELGKVWKPIVQNEVCYPIGQQLYKDQDCIQIGVNQLKAACQKVAPEVPKQKPVIPERLVIEDCPLKQMAKKILTTAQGKSKSANVSPQERALLADFCNKLEDAIKSFDTANAKCRNQPTDAKRRGDLESEIMNLQQMCLFSKDLGAEESYIVDLANYVSSVTSAAEDVVKASCQVTPATADVKKVKDESQKIVDEAETLLNAFDVESAEITDDMLKYDLFGKSCEDRVKVMTEAAFEIPDSKPKIDLQDKVHNLAENIDLLRFASRCNLSNAMGISVDETLDHLTDIEKHIEDMITPTGQSAGRAEDAKAMIVDAQEALVSSLVSSDHVPTAFAEYALHMRSAAQADDKYKRKLKDHLKRLADLLKSQVAVRGRMLSTWQDIDGPETTAITDKIIQELDSFNRLEDSKPEDSLAASNEFKNLLMTKSHKISGKNEELLGKFRKQVNKLSIDANTLVLSSHQPESLGRCVHLISESASAAAATARSVRTENPMMEKQIQDAAQNMCKATYRIVKVAQSLQRTENKADARRRLQDACRQLNDAINRLVRTVIPGNKEREGDELARNLQMQGAFLRAKLPSNTLGYKECLEALQNQQEIIQKLGSNDKMTKAERTESLNYITSAICNATEYATQTAYLLSLSYEDRGVMERGLADVGRLRKITANLRGECMRLLYCGDAEQIKHIKSEISKQTDALQKSIEDDSAKIDELLRPVLMEDIKKLQAAVSEMQKTVDHNDNTMGTRIKGICKVIDASNRINTSIEKIIEPQTSVKPQGSSQEIIDNTRDLVSNTSSLIKKASASDDDVMTWVVFGGADVMKTFEKLVQCVRQKGIDADLIASVKQEDTPVKSYIDTQIDLAKKWLMRPSSKPEIKDAGIKAITYTIDMADKITDDLNEAEKEDMKQVVTEGRQLLAECTQKYNSEKASLLLERLKELKKMLERGVVTRVVEDFLHDDHLLDMENLVAKEQEKSKRKFILERKIAELQAQLGKVTQTARLVADTGCGHARRDLLDTTNKVELLAPSLVKAAQDRLESPENKEAVEKYMALVEQYAKMIASMRDLCDRAVDPIDFVQAAGETMQRIKEDTSSNDPNTTKITSRVILRLGNRVVDAGMNSAERQKDPEMQTTLTIIKKTIVCPKSDVHESQDEWKTIFSEILKKTSQVESVLGGEGIFNREPEPDQPIFAAALDLHAAVRDWSARDNDIVALAKRMAVLMAKLSRSMETDNTRELLSTSKEIVCGAEDVAAVARKLALECTDMRIRTNLLQVCDKIPTIGGQLKILTTVKGSSLGHQGSFEDQEAMNMLVCNAQNLMTSIQEVVKAAASASVKINSQRGRRMKWVRRKNYY